MIFHIDADRTVDTLQCANEKCIVETTDVCVQMVVALCVGFEDSSRITTRPLDSRDND